jgi:hypothetical protein
LRHLSSFCYEGLFQSVLQQRITHGREQMTGLRYADVEYRDNECMDLTSLTQDEFAEVLPTFEAAFQERMQNQSGITYLLFSVRPLRERSMTRRLLMLPHTRCLREACCFRI